VRNKNDYWFNKQSNSNVPKTRKHYRWFFSRNY
jgi:hypothetical protein